MKAEIYYRPTKPNQRFEVVITWTSGAQQTIPCDTEDEATRVVRERSWLVPWAVP